MRYFDADRGRPGLPEDVAAFVDRIEAGAVGIRLVNTGSRPRSLIVHAGAFGEHKFTDVSYAEHDNEALNRNAGAWLREARDPVERCATANGKHFVVQLPPFTSVRLEAGMERFVNTPTYAFPWHGGRVPVE